jgi:hypothetical protein
VIRAVRCFTQPVVYNDDADGQRQTMIAGQGLYASIEVMGDGQPLSIPLGISVMAGSAVLAAGAVAATVYIRRWNRIRAAKVADTDARNRQLTPLAGLLVVVAG